MTGDGITARLEPHRGVTAALGSQAVFQLEAFALREHCKQKDGLEGFKESSSSCMLTWTHGVAGQFVVEEILGLAGSCICIDADGNAFIGLGTETEACVIVRRLAAGQAHIVHGFEADIACLGTANAAIAHGIQLARVRGGACFVLVVRTTADVEISLLQGITLGTDRSTSRHADGHLGARTVHAFHANQLTFLVAGAAHLIAEVAALAGGAAIGIHLITTLAAAWAASLGAGVTGVLLADGHSRCLHPGARQLLTLCIHTPTVAVGRALYLLPAAGGRIALRHAHLACGYAQLGALVQLDALQMLAGGLELRLHTLRAAAIRAAAPRALAMRVRAAFVGADVGVQVIRGTRRHQVRALARLAGQAGRHGRAVFALAAHIDNTTLLAPATGDAVAGITALAGGAAGVRIQGKAIFAAHAAGEIQTIEFLAQLLATLVADIVAPRLWNLGAKAIDAPALLHLHVDQIIVAAGGGTLGRCRWTHLLEVGLEQLSQALLSLGSHVNDLGAASDCRCWSYWNWARSRSQLHLERIVVHAVELEAFRIAATALAGAAQQHAHAAYGILLENLALLGTCHAYLAQHTLPPGIVALVGAARRRHSQLHALLGALHALREITQILTHCKREREN